MLSRGGALLHLVHLISVSPQCTIVVPTYPVTSCTGWQGSSAKADVGSWDSVLRGPGAVSELPDSLLVHPPALPTCWDRCFAGVAGTWME